MRKQIKGENSMNTVLGLVIIAEVIVMSLIIVGLFHEDKLIAFEDKLIAVLRARHIAKKRAKAKAYLRKTSSGKAPARSLRLIKGGKYSEDVA